MNYHCLGPVDTTLALSVLPTLTFVDTGGSNGHLATDHSVFTAFVKTLPLRGVIKNVQVRKLVAGIGIPPHVDPPAYASPQVREHRYHVPLVTHPAVTMRWPDDHDEVHLEAGQLYEVYIHDRVHEVVQQAPIDRIHLVIDTVERVPCS